MRIVVFSGTTEGRDFSRAAAALGIAVTVSVATDLGAEEQGQAPGITVHSGRLLPGAMAELLQGAALCVDATHPYAVEATKNIRAAANAAGVEYHRLLRAASTLPAGSVVLGSAAQAAQYLAATQGNILLTTGAKELAAFAGLDAAHRGGHYGVRGRGHPAPQHHCHAGALYAGTEPCTDAAVPHPLPCHQGRRQRGRLCRESPGCRPKRGCAGCTAPPGGMRRDRRRNFATMQGAVMKITLVGMGSGLPGSLTAQGLQALQTAGLILGAKRLLQNLPDGCTPNRKPIYLPDEVLACLQAEPCQTAALVYSGDTGFYSGAAALVPKLRAQGAEVTVLPGVSSVQLLAAALGRPWQNWHLVSAHGCACAPAAECRSDRPTFFLTGGRNTSPAALCEILAAAGFGAVQATVGENLGTPQQKVITDTVQTLAGGSFAPLSVLLVEPCPKPQPRVPGLPDEAFIRGKTPMTKQEVRAAALAKLAVAPTDTLWDVGAGTGSVSVEMALAAPMGQVYAVECDADACALVRQNQAKFAASNLTLIAGKAPEALQNLPAPDAVFIGGSKGNMQAIVDAALAANPQTRLCIAAIALETLQQSIAALAAHGLAAQVTQIAVSRSKAAGSLHLMMANNPVFLIVRE